MENKRTVFVRSVTSARGENKTWTEIEFKDLIKDNTFKLFDPGSDVLVMDKEGNTVFRATSNPYTNKDGILTIDTVGVINSEG